MIDDTELEISVRSLRAKQEDLRVRQSKIHNLIGVMTSIQLKSDGTTQPDPYTGSPISEARRQEIFDACQPEVEAILNYVPITVRVYPSPKDEDDAPDSA